MKPMIVLQTDFSLSWSAVCEMKGVIKSIDRELEIFDNCHEIRQYDPWEASLSLNTVVPYWPKGTIFVSVVDPTVGTERRASCALLNDGKYVLTPDNGTLTNVLHSIGIREIRQIDAEKNRYPVFEEVSVFDGRDLFAYNAARLASGKIAFADIGPSYPVHEIVECREYHTRPIFRDHSVECFIMTGLKHFGGIEFNISNESWVRTGVQEGMTIHVTIAHAGNIVFDQPVRYEKSFGYVEKGEPVLYRGSSAYLSLDCNQDNFMARYDVGTGLDWTARLSWEK